MTGTVKAPSAHDQTTGQVGTNQAIIHGYLYDPNKPQQGTGPSRNGGGKKGVSYPGPRDVWGPAVAQKYKVHHNAPFSKEKFKKNFSPEGPRKMFGGGPAKMLPRAPLWLSTDLARHDLKSALLAD